jgi:parvulin-like peptidyl-prolyl isomerase
MKMKMRIAALALVLGSSSLVAQTVASHGSNAKAAAANPTVEALPPAKPVARVNGTVLTDRDLLREMLAIFPYARQHNGGFPKEMEADIRRGALKMIEFEELVYQEALRQKMSVAPERLAKAEKDFRARFANEQEYQQFLKLEGDGSVQEVRRRIKRSLLIEDLLKADVTNKAVVTMADAKAFYDKNPDRFKLPETYALQTITLMPPKNATPDQLKQLRKRAEDALRQAKATKNYEEFGLLAEKISEDDYRVMMGDHKAVGITELPPPVLQVAASLPQGQVSDLIEVEQALTIIRVNGHTASRMQTFDEAKVQLQSALHQKKLDQKRREFDALLRKTAKIEEL